MGKYDAVYARTNCDWPDDGRCKALPDDQTRWFNHLLWLEAVKQKSSVLPTRCDAAYWSNRLQCSVDRIEEMVKAMAVEGLVAWTKSGEIVVVGVQKYHDKLKWVQTEPTDIVNPFKKTGGWSFLRISGEISGYPEDSPDMGRYPVKSPTVEYSREEKRREEKISCSEAPLRGPSEPAPPRGKFVPTTKKPFTTDRGPYDIDESEIYAWLPVRDCKDSRGWPFTLTHGRELVKRFTPEGDESGTVDEEIATQLRKMGGWLMDNPSRRKTPRGMPKFVGSWIERHFNSKREIRP